MSNPDLTPQTPGVMPGANVDHLQKLADGSVAEIAEAVGHLPDAELEQLLTFEKAGKARSTALTAIQREIDARAQPPQDEPKIQNAPLGDTQNFADMHWHEVDQTKLAGPVLTKDGWLHPTPAAQPQG